jgi:uncharacterized membrane protein (DUF485 family)
MKRGKGPKKKDGSPPMASGVVLFLSPFIHLLLRSFFPSILLSSIMRTEAQRHTIMINLDTVCSIVISTVYRKNTCQLDRMDSSLTTEKDTKRVQG